MHEFFTNLKPLLYVVVFDRWDIIAERLGFMLVFGDLVWIPFTFSIQARYHELEHENIVFLTYHFKIFFYNSHYTFLFIRLLKSHLSNYLSQSEIQRICWYQVLGQNSPLLFLMFKP